MCVLAVTPFLFAKQSSHLKVGNHLSIINQDALLELESDSGGLLLPRLALNATNSPSPLSKHVKGMFVYDTVYSAVGTTDSLAVSPGIYYNDGTQWIKVAAENEPATPKFFYMPPVVLPTDTTDHSLYDAYNAATGVYTVNLYNRYESQYTLASATSSTSNSGAATPLPLYLQSDLEYFITYYDSSVFDLVKVDNNGVLTYTLKPAPLPISAKTFMTIVFKVNY